MEQETNNLTEQVIKKIDEEKVVPIARWHFVLKNKGFWALWGVSIIVGSCATAATIFTFLNSGWKYRAITHDSFFAFFFDIMPIFWLISIVIMIIFGYYNVRHTSKGYRFSFVLVVFASMIISFIGGTLLYTVGIGGDIDGLRKPLPFGPPILMLEEERWNNSQRGLLSGTVKSFDQTKGELIIASYFGQEKTILTNELEGVPLGELKADTHIRIIGFESNEQSDKFVACAILPLGQPNHFAPNPQHKPRFLIDERNLTDERINTCKDVRPYQRYQERFITN